MIVIHVNHTNYKLLLQDVAAAMGIPAPQHDLLLIPVSKGKGYFKAFDLHNDLHVLLADFSINETVMTVRERSDNRYFILHFDDVLVTDTAVLKVDGEQLQKSNTRHAVARLTSNVFVNTEELPARIHIKSVKVLFNENWLKRYMGLQEDDDVLQKYLSLKTESFDIEPLNSTYLQLMDDLWSVRKEDPLQLMLLQNRVTLLIERFFSSLFSKVNLLQGKFDLSSEVIHRLLQVEHELIHDFSKQPPTIDQFSKLVSMSSTKLKKSFKSMFGNSIYAYYQKQRLSKARELLLSGRYTIKQSAQAVGYTNVGNFTLAFKKQFNQPPEQLLAQQVR
ncbi:MAG: helix-turn-helix transcriptional regulator [Bacteroidetes bacterium]|nr:helix-turn-helix transcriptional regulator [Bacteroidota bacterium]